MTDLPTPVEIDDATMAFPANALDFMPALEDIPEDFQRETKASAPWYQLQGIWFGLGLHEKFSFTPAEVNGERLDAVKVWRQLSTIQRSFSPKHEHKMAAVAWLASIWMEDVIYGPPGAALEDLLVAGEAPLEEWLTYFRSLEKEEA